MAEQNNDLDLQLSPEQIETANTEIIFIADHVVAKLSNLETQYPYLSDDNGFLFFKAAIRDESQEPSGTLDVLRNLYDELVEYLRELSIERKEIAQIDKSQVLRLSRFLPASFEDLHRDFQRVKNSEMEEDGQDILAERLVYGELEGGLSAVPLNCRLEVRRRVLEALIYDHGEEDSIKLSLSRVDNDKLFELLSMSDSDLEKMAEDKKTKMADVANIILATRGQIDHEHGVMFGSPIQGKDDDEGLAELEAARNMKRKLQAPRKLEVVK